MNYTRALSGNFGVEVADPDVATMSDDELRELLFALYTNRIAVLRTGGLTEVEYVDFARRIGDPLLLIPDKVAYPEIIPVDNLREHKEDEAQRSPLAHGSIVHESACERHHALLDRGPIVWRSDPLLRHGGCIRRAV